MGRDILESQSTMRLYYGVFEGGGAKGLAYVGSLRAMRSMECWFQGVAGSSAGALTAALIAAGLNPGEIELETNRALAAINTSPLQGLRRLRATGGYFSSEALRGWMNDVLAYCLIDSRPPSALAPVTFSELYAATNIELVVVAADVSLGKQLIFSHQTTPDCAVADAVVASSAIPFAFPSQALGVASPGNHPSVVHHTVVDGGVWANYPDFVFADVSFRKHHGLTPAEIPSERILGFVLEESDRKMAESTMHPLSFLVPGGKGTFDAWEWQPDSANGKLECSDPDETPFPGGPPATEPKRSFWYHLCAGALLPIELLGRLVSDGTDRAAKARWTRFDNLILARVVATLDGFLGALGGVGRGGISALFPPALTLFCLITGCLQVIRWITGQALSLFQAPASAGVSDISNAIAGALAGIAVFLTGLGVGVLTIFVGLVGILFCYFLYLPARQQLVGLVRTMVNAPGAPVWALRRANVVPICVPEGLRTLTFDPPDAVRGVAERRAHNATLRTLAVLDSRRSTN